MGFFVGGEIIFSAYKKTHGTQRPSRGDLLYKIGECILSLVLSPDITSFSFFLGPRGKDFFCFFAFYL